MFKRRKEKTKWFNYGKSNINKARNRPMLKNQGKRMR